MAMDRRIDRKKGNAAHAFQLLDKEPPFNLEAEAAVLGSIILNPEVCDDVALIIRPDDFYDDAHRKIFECMLEMHDSGKKVDAMLLVDRLRSTGDLDRVGGTGYLAKVFASVPNAAHSVYYSKIVREKATFRSLIEASSEILRDAYGESTEAKQLLSNAEQRIFSILDSRGSATVQSIRDVLHEAMDRLDARMKGEHASGGCETGFTDLDNLTGGLHDSELVVLAARPSMGKTALAMNVAEHSAFRLKLPTLFVSLEMSGIELADRLLCSAARVNGHKLRNGQISSADRQRLLDKAGELSHCPFFVDDSPSRMVTEIAAAARRIKRREGKLGLIVIDYLQLIEPDNPKDSRQEQVARMTRRLKGIARELQVPILCLAQLNRQAEDSKDHRPKLSHLRESGAIEQDADVVMFVHREEYYHRGEDQEQHAGEALIIVAKQRNGPTGEIELVWKKDYTRFENKAPERFQELADFNNREPAVDF